MVFDLLTVPQVALRQILGGLSATELFELYQCSKRTMRKAKFFEKTSKKLKASMDCQRLEIEIRGVRLFRIRNKEEGKVYSDLKPRVFDGKEFETEQDEDQNINVFCAKGEEQETLRMVARSFDKVLGLGRYDNMLIDIFTPREDVMEWVKNEGAPVDNFNVDGCPEDQVDAFAQIIFSSEVMKKVNGNFSSLINPSEGFIPTGFKPSEVISMVKFQVAHAHWLTLQHLKCFNASCLVLYDSKLSNEHIKEYLKAVNDGHYNKLFFLSITREDGTWNLPQIIEGLADAKDIKDENNQQSIVFPRAGGWQFEIEVQDDGTKLLVTIDEP